MDIVYTVKEINQVRMYMDVDFPNHNQWARIPLTLPFPQTKEQVDELVRKYAPTEEQILAVQTNGEGLEFVQALIGVEKTTTAMTSKIPVTPPPPPVELTLEQKQQRVWSKIQRERDRRKYNGVKVGAHWFYTDADTRSQFGLLDTKATRENWPDNAVLDENWKTMSPMANPVYVPMTVLLMRQIIDAGTAMEKANYANGEAHRVAMLAAVDPDAYDFSTGWHETYVWP